MNHPSKLVLLILWVIFCLPLNSYCQNLQRLDSILKSDQPNENKISDAKKLIASSTDSLHYLNHNFSYWVYDVDREMAIEYELLAIDGCLSEEPDNLNFLEFAYVSLGYYYEMTDQLKLAIESYEEVIKLDLNSRFTINAYEKVAYISRELQDYFKSIEFYTLVIELLLENNKEKPLSRRMQSLLRNAYLNQSTNYREIGDSQFFPLSEKFGLIADSIAEARGDQNTARFRIKLGLAELNNQYENLNIPRAQKYYEQALEIAKERQDSASVATVYLGLGSLYNTTDYTKAESYLFNALNYIDPDESRPNYLVHARLGTVYARMENYQKSIDYYHRGLSFFFGNKLENFNDLSVSTISGNEYLDYQFDGIPKLAETYLKFYEEEKDPLLLEKSLAFFNMADIALDLKKLNSSEYKSRLYWRRLSSGLYSKAIRACLLADDMDKAFYYMEKNKALLLLEDLSNDKFKQALELPESFIEREQEIEQKRYLISSQLSDPGGLTNDDITSLRKEKINLENELNTLKDGLGISENTFQLEQEILSFAQNMEGLGEDEMILEYHISSDDGFGIYTNTDKGFLLAITRDGGELFELEEIDDTREKTIELIDLMKRPFVDKSDIDDYMTLSYELYEKLIPGQELRDQLVGKKITIIPDSFLSFLPFEALSTSADSLRYMIQDHQISYQYSNSFLAAIQSNENGKKKFLAAAPVTFNYDDLATLSNSADEVTVLDNYFSGTTWTISEASKAQFSENLGDYSLIHLATHADAGTDTDPWIAFSDEKLSLSELYLLDNQAALVFLSGCNTTLGKQEIGEGVMSLARGFFYGGAQSVISSLWSIDDKATTKVVSDFYSNLDIGQTKSEALHNAKLNYLNTHNLSDSSPYYWASFIFMGQEDPIPQQTPAWVYVLLIGFALLLIYTFWRRLKK